MKKQNKGITLIALIITIVVMLILVGIVVSTTINSNLINKVKRAKGEWERAEGEDSNIAGVTVDGKYYGSLKDYAALFQSAYAYSSGGPVSVIVDGIKYRKTSDTTVEVAGPEYKSVVTVDIPRSITFDGKGYDVTSIGLGAFWGCDSLTGVTIPGSVKTITTYAFYNCINLTSITIPESVTNIINSAFWGCTSLTSITVAEGNANYSSKDGVLYNKDKTYLIVCPPGKTGSVEIPESVARIDMSAFSYCSVLTSITIPANVSYIDTMAFNNCASLTSIIVAEGNANYSSQDGVLYNKDKTGLIRWPGGKTGTLEIAEGVTNISSSAFSNCSGLTSITIPASVTYLDSYMFSNCTNLTSITVADGNTNYSSEDGVLYNKDKTELILCLPGKTGTLEIAEGVTSIGSSAFNGCSGLTSITIPAGVTYLDTWAFSSCTNLTSITVAEGNENYSSLDGILYNKDKTELIVCPAGKTGNLEIAEGVTSIGSSAFNGCSGLTSITVAQGNTHYSSEDGVVYNKDRTQLIVCPAGKTGTVEIPDSVTNISFGAFAGCNNLTSISVKDADQKQLVLTSMMGFDNGIIIQRDLQT